MKKLILFLLLILTFNCKEDKKEDEQEIKKGVVEINEKFIKYKSDKLIKYFIIKSMEEDKTYSHQDLLDIDNTLPYGNYKLIYPSFYNTENETIYIFGGLYHFESTVQLLHYLGKIEEQLHLYW